MAHERTHSQRRFAAVDRRLVIVLAALASVGLGACSPSEPTGWLAPDPVERLVVPAGSTELAVEVRLPAGFEAADEFTQRATLRIGETTLTVERADLAEAFRVNLPGDAEWGSSEATLEVMLGFCEPTAREICYIDVGVITVEHAPVSPRGAADEGRDGVPYSVIYRPESPL